MELCLISGPKSLVPVYKGVEIITEIVEEVILEESTTENISIEIVRTRFEEWSNVVDVENSGDSDDIIWLASGLKVIVVLCKREHVSCELE